jgi:kynurenine formamidase
MRKKWRGNRFEALGRTLPVLLLAGFLSAGCEPGMDTGPAGAPSETGTQVSLLEFLETHQMVELTHPLGEETIVWPTSRPFEFETTFEGWTEEGYYYASRDFSGPEHGGTHLDAPIHFYEDRWTTDQIPLDHLVAPGAVVDVSESVAEDPNYRVSVNDLMDWEDAHGRIPSGAILMLHTGKGAHWPDAVAYMGTAGTGEEALAHLQFPGLHPDAARWLVEDRDVVAVGLDTPSLDYGPSTNFEAHQILFEANIYGLENVANLHELPPTGSTILALPTLLEGGTGGPVRIIALVP